MAGLAHRDHVAQCVGAAGCETVDFPLSPEHRVTPAGMMATRFHRALALATCSRESFFSNICHFAPPTIMPRCSYSPAEAGTIATAERWSSRGLQSESRYISPFAASRR